MKTRTSLRLLGAVAMSLTALLASADELEAVERKICTAWSKHKSVRAKLTMEMHMEQAGQKIDSKGEGTHEMLRKGDKVLTRMDLKSTMTQEMGDQEMKMEQTVLVIVDGEHAYTYSENVTEFMGSKMPVQKMAAKNAIDPQMSGDPKTLFEHLRKDHQLKLLPEQTVGERKCFTIEATPKDQRPDVPMSKMVMFFDAENGCLIKMVGHGPDGKPLHTTTYSNIELNVDLHPQRFVFNLPEGVELMDLTRSQP